jgi:predicted transcriptional regulator
MIPNVRSGAVADLAEQVLAILKQRGQMAADELVDEVRKQQGIDDRSARASIWRLIDEGRVRVDWSTKLGLAS